MERVIRRYQSSVMLRAPEMMCAMVWRGTSVFGYEDAFVSVGRVHNCRIEIQIDAWAKVFGREDFYGQVRINLANDLCGVAVCEVGFLDECRGQWFGSINGLQGCAMSVRWMGILSCIERKAAG
jgi:hypothetical protein